MRSQKKTTAQTPLERLVATGRMALPKGDLLELSRPPGPPDAKRRLSKALDVERAERLR